MHYKCQVFHQNKHFDALDEITSQQIAYMHTKA
jgi:hypothetical protein